MNSLESMRRVNLIRHNVGFTEDEYTYIKRQMERLNTSKLSETIELLMIEHKELNQRKLQDELLVENIFLRLKTELDVIRVRTGHADKNSRIQLELWNSFMLANNIENFVSTADFMTTPLTRAKLKVEDEISNYRQKKLEREKNKG